MSRRFNTWRGMWLCIAIALTSLSTAAAQLPSVGMPGRVTELVLPGSEVEVRARDAKDPLVLRITRVAPHGSAFRYDFEYVALEAGKYDLRDALRRRDGTPIVTDPGDPNALPSIPVEVTSVLAPGIVKPHVPEPQALPRFGAYRTWLVAAGVVWLAGLALVLFGLRKKHAAMAAARWKPRTLAERLRPLVESALAGTLEREQRAQLELGLVAFWRRKLAMEHESPVRTMSLLRDHAQAGPLLKSLEAWLHMPTPPADVDLKALLEPYRDMPADAIPEFDTAALSAPHSSGGR